MASPRKISPTRAKRSGASVTRNCGGAVCAASRLQSALSSRSFSTAAAVVWALSTMAMSGPAMRGDRVLEHRIMRAAEQQAPRMRHGRQQRIEIAMDDGLGDGAPWSGLLRRSARRAGRPAAPPAHSLSALDGAHIGAAAHRAFGGDDGDGAVAATAASAASAPGSITPITGRGAKRLLQRGQRRPRRCCRR